MQRRTNLCGSFLHPLCHEVASASHVVRAKDVAAHLGPCLCWVRFAAIPCGRDDCRFHSRVHHPSPFAELRQSLQSSRVPPRAGGYFRIPQSLSLRLAATNAVRVEWKSVLAVSVGPKPSRSVHRVVTQQVAQHGLNGGECSWLGNRSTRRWSPCSSCATRTGVVGAKNRSPPVWGAFVFSDVFTRRCQSRDHRR